MLGQLASRLGAHMSHDGWTLRALAGHGRRQWLARTTAILVALAAGAVIEAAPAQAVTQTATTQAQLATYLSDGTTGTVVLGANISITDGSNLTVSQTQAKALDLHGHTLSVSSVSSGAAIDASAAASLVVDDLIGGGGSLTVAGATNGAGIGGSNTENAGSIEIDSGTVTATGGSGAAGIGGGAGGSGGHFTITGGSVQATGGANGAGVGGGNGGLGGNDQLVGGSLTAQGGTSGAGIGGGNGAAGNVVVVSGPVSPTSVTFTGTGGSGAAGIGGGSGGAGATLSMSGGGVAANGGQNGAGFGGGNGAAGGTATINGGSLFATGGQNGAGVGGGNTGSGGALTIGASGAVTATDGQDGQSSAVGIGAHGTGFGSVTNAGALVIPSGATMSVPSAATAQNLGTLINKGTLTADPNHGAGTVENDGIILNTGTIQNNGDGGSGNITVSKHNYVITFDVNGGPSATPSLLRAYAQSISLTGQSLPSVSPPTGGIFLGWYTAASGGTQVTETTDLSSVFADGPSTTTLFAHYRLPQTITFGAIGDQVYGAVDFAVSATASSGLSVSLAASPSSVCSISGSTVHLVGAGSCTIAADQGGDAAYLPAPEVLRSFQVKTGVLTVTATGAQTYEGQPTFTPTGSLPPNVTLSGSLSCSGLTGNVEIAPALAPGNYTIDPTTCGGIVLSGSAAANFHLAYGGGEFVVSKAIVAVTATGSQSYGAAATLTPVATTPPNVSLSGTLSCATVDGGTAISPSLPVGSYLIDQASCGGLSLTGSQSGGYQINYDSGSFTVVPQPVVVTATGTEGYGGSPTFTPVATLPANIAFSGTLTCTSLTGNIPISPTMGVGASYTIDHTSCSGLSLSGPNAGNYQIQYANGPFAVTKAHIVITTHTNSFTAAQKAHKFVFTTTVMNTDANAPVAGVKVTITVKITSSYSVTCSAVTNSSGVATCSSGNGNLYVQPGRSYTATTPASANYLAGFATGKIGS